uniref:Acyl transferase domain-containing protein n=1 Tax=Candidatus Kentrum sp. DK TaxID=2126562 RepID=A0A450S0N9_9GAMM|nr:MAG: Acyl transferase domain-containing protein [Candidatus Kentron sp. DK]
MPDLENRIEKLSPLQQAALAIRQMQSKLDTMESARQEPIAIIGMGCRLPGANSPDTYWQLLQNGIDAVTEVPSDRWNIDDFYDPDPEAPGKIYTRHGGFLPEIDKFDPEFFGMSPRETVDLDPQQRLLLEVAWEALENACQSPEKLIDTPVGVFVGVSQMEYGGRQLFRHPNGISAYTGTGGGLCFNAGRISYVLGLQGPAVALDTACSSSLVSIHLACQSLRNGESRMALAGGVNVNLSPEIMVALCRVQALSPDGRCKTFDAGANGYVRGEGCGLVVLKRLSDAVADKDNILALIRGSAVNHDGVSSGFSVPNRLAQEQVIRQALDSAGITPGDVDYVEAHGTGTSLGDPIEVEALRTVFAKDHSKDSPLVIASVKTNFGHLESAAGVTSLMKAVLALRHEAIPPHLHFKEPNPHIDWNGLPFRIPVALESWPRGRKQDGKRRIVGVSSFGMSGTNAHIILEEAPLATAEAPERVDRPLQLLTLSAKSEAALRAMAESYAAWLEANPDVPLADVCFSAYTGRTHFEHRLAIAADSSEEAGARLRAADYLSGKVGDGESRTVFLFTGQGSQYPGMGRGLYETEPLFRDAIDRCDGILREYDVPLLDLLYPEQPDAAPDISGDMRWLQPALFSLEYALAELWQSWGVKPDVVMGHSLGEYVAACVAGVFSLEDGLKLVANRGRLMQSCEEGRMLAVSISEEKALEIIAPFEGDVSVATINAPESVVVSGRPDAINAVLAELAGDDTVDTKLLPIPRASHSPLMEPILDEFQRIAASVTLSKPKIALCSNVTGDLVTEEVTDPAYWARHLREPVRFAKSIRTLHGQGFDTFLEIGPKPALLGMVAQCLPDDAEIIQIPSLREGQDDWRQLLGSLGQWHIHGGTVDWKAFDKGHARRKVQLPTYPFQRSRYWIEEAPDGKDKGEKALLPETSVFALLREGDTDQLAEQLRQTARLPDEALAQLPMLLDVLAKQYRRETLTDTLKDWLYEVAWQSRPRPVDLAGGPGHWLILADGGGMGRELADGLEAAGHTCTLAYAHPAANSGGAAGTAGGPALPDSAFHLDPANPEDFHRLFQDALPADAPPLSGIVYLWALDAPDSLELTAETLLAAERLICGGALHLIQAAARREEAAKIWLVTRDAVSPEREGAGNGGRTLSVAQAPLWGLGRVVSQEYPALWGGMIDDPAAADLLAEIGAGMGAAPGEKEDQVAYRDGRRYVARLARSRLPLLSGGAPPEVTFEPDGSYLITGGLGALGLAVARWMVAEGARHLALTGRRGPSDKAREVLTALEEAGATVRVISADVSDPTQAAGLFAEVDANMPPLKGLIHAAGVVDYGPLAEQTWERFGQAMAAKTIGSWHLHTLTQSRDLDFFVCFSSSSSLLGGLRLGSYAAANSFLDTLAHFRKNLGLPCSSINWGPWEDDGMFAAASRNATEERRSEYAFPAETGVRILGALIGADPIRVAVLPGNLPKYLWEFYPGEVPALFESFRAVPDEEDAGSAKSGKFVEELEKVAPEKRRDYLKARVRSELNRVLGFDPSHPMDANKGFSDIGMDSLMMVESRNRLQTDLGRAWPSTLLFNYSTLDNLVNYIAGDLLGAGSPPPRESSAQSEETREVSGDDLAEMDDLSEEDVEALIDEELASFQISREDL